MPAIACVIDDAKKRARLARIIASLPAMEVVSSECHPGAVESALIGSQVEAAFVCQMAFPRFLEMRTTLYKFASSGGRPRIIIAAENVDSAFAYRALAFGADDVIDVAGDDGRLARAIRMSLSDAAPSFGGHLVREVDTQADITSLSINYFDDVDRRIVPMIVAGFTDREIADVVHLSHQAVRNRISRLLLRSGIRNRTQLASAFLVGRLDDGGSSQPGESTQ